MERETSDVGLPASASSAADHQRFDAIDGQLRLLHERVDALMAINQQLLDELLTLRQGQATHGEAVVKLEREVRRGRWMRRIGVAIRWLIFLAILGGLIYFLADWRSWLQLLV